MNIKKVLPIVIIGMFLFLATYGQVITADEVISKQEQIYEVRDYYKDAQRDTVYNPENPDYSKLNYMNWFTDFVDKGENIPKGVYDGSYLSPSVFECDYTPTEETRLGEGQLRGRYGITIVSTTKQFSPDQIMNGASEFWVKLPIKSDLTHIPLQVSDDFGDGVTTAYSRIYSGFYMFEGTNTNFKINGSNNAGMLDLRANDGTPSVANAIINNEDRINGTYYQKMNAIVESGAIYTFATILITKEKPKILLDEVQKPTSTISYKVIDVINYNYNTRTYGGFSDENEVIGQIYANLNERITEELDILVEPHFSFIFTGGMGQSNMFGYRMEKEGKVVQSLYHDFDGTENITYPSIYTPFEYDTLGNNGLKPKIGFNIANGTGSTLHRTHVEENNTYYKYDFQTDFDGDGIGTRYIEGIHGLERNNYGGIGYAEAGHAVGYENWIRQDYNYSFNKYFLFSSKKVQYQNDNTLEDYYGIGGDAWYSGNTPDDGSPYIGDGYIQLSYDNIPTNLTFLCKADINNYYTKVYENQPSMEVENYVTAPGKNQSDPARVIWNNYQKITSYWMGENFRIYEPNTNWTRFYINSRSEKTISFNFTNLPERFFFDIHTSLKFTEGRWNTIKLPTKTVFLPQKEAERRGVSDKQILFMRHRNWIIRVEDEEINVGNPGSSSGGLNLDALPTLGDVKKALNNLYDSIVGAIISKLRDFWDDLKKDLNSVWTYIQSLPEKAINALQKLGRWVVRNVMEFIKPILEVAGDLMDLGGMYLEVLSYAFSFVVFFLVMYAIVKVLGFADLEALRGL